MKKDTVALTGTTVLAALVFIFDYTMKFSGLRIPFPWLPNLKFDFTGVPIVLSTLLFGLASGATTSAIAFLAILIRSGDVVGASMKALAEFSTILGMTLASKRFAKKYKADKGCVTILRRRITIANDVLRKPDHPASVLRDFTESSILPKPTHSSVQMLFKAS